MRFIYKSSRWIAVAILVVGSSGCMAQSLANVPDSSLTTPGAMSLTLDEALEISYGQNPLIEAQRHALDASIARRKAAVGLRIPSLSASASYAYMSEDIKAFDFNPQKNQLIGAIGQLPIPIPPQLIQGIKGLDLSMTLQKQQFGMVTGNIVAPIYMGGRINAAVGAAKIGVERSRQQAAAARTDLFAEVVERYYSLSLAMHLLDVQRQVVSSMEKHLSDATELEKNGMIASTEKLYVEMFLAKARGAEQAAVHNIATLNSAMSASLGVKAADGAALAATKNYSYTPLTAMFVVEHLPSLESLRESTLKNNPTLSQVELARRLAREGVKAARANFLPEIAAMGVYDIYNYQLTDLAPKWAVGAGVKLRIFDGLTSEYRHSAAKAEVRQVESMQLKAEADILTLVDKLYNQMLSSREQVHALDAAVAFAESYLSSRQKAFAEGMAPSSEVVDARLNLAKNSTERLVAAYTFDVTLAQLLALSGRSELYTTLSGQPDFRIITF